MPIIPRYHSVECILYWPTRASIQGFHKTFCGNQTRNRPVQVNLAYEPILHVVGVTVPANSWTKITLNFEKLFEREWNEFLQWATTPNGQTQLLDDTIKLQNLLIDHLKLEFPYNPNPGKPEPNRF